MGNYLVLVGGSFKKIPTKNDCKQGFCGGKGGNITPKSPLGVQCLISNSAINQGQ